MNILWMTLCTCMVLLISMDWGLQSMRRDQKFLQVAQRYFRAFTGAQLACQRHYYGQLKREWTGLKTMKSPEEAFGDPLHIQEMSESLQENSQDQEQEIKLFRFSAYPLNARFPLSVKNMKDAAKSTYWKEGFWKLLDNLYGDESFYSGWRHSVDSEAFVEEMIEKIEALSTQWAGTGTLGLLRVSFSHPGNQQVWDQMLRGSDLMGTQFPSLLVYIWACDFSLGRNTFAQRLNLPTASFECIAALLGESFAKEWSERVSQEKEKRMELGGYQVSLNLPLLFESKKYSQILQDCKNLAIIAEDQLMSFIDLSTGNWQLMDEYLLKDPDLGFAYLASTLQVRSKQKK
jgi:hypothetical protein